VLYYKSEAWYLGSLRKTSASGNALRMAAHYPNRFISLTTCTRWLIEQHPKLVCLQAIIIDFKTYSEKVPKSEWIDLNFKQIMMSQQ
jgi:hypothetical protein